METVYNVLFLVAVVVALTGFVVWTISAPQFVSWNGFKKARAGSWGTKEKILLACTAFGAAYGAAFGSFWVLSLWLPSGSGSLWAVGQGAIYGLALGAFGGGVAGFAGNAMGHRAGWWRAGILGSAAAAACVWIAACMAAAWEPRLDWGQKFLSDGLLACSVIILIGGYLGFALDRARRSGRSPVPGVRWLAAIIEGCGPA